MSRIKSSRNRTRPSSSGMSILWKKKPGVLGPEQDYTK